MVFNGNKTMYSNRLQNYTSLGLPYTPLINTTLNEKFGINARFELTETSTKTPAINVLTIGTDFNLKDTSNNVLNMKLSPHSPLDASLFNHIPFYLRRLDEVDDYPPNSAYMLRKEILIDDITYIAYYGYYIDDIVYEGDVVKYDNIETDYVTISKVETNDGSYLNPTPRDNISLDKQPDSFVGSFFKMFFFFTEDELIEMLHVFDVLYPEADLRRITELGICSSIYEESINDVVWCGIEYYVDVEYNVEEAADKTFLEFYVEVGNSEVIRS